MWYLEYLRARRALAIYGIIVVLMIAIALVVRLNVSTHGHSGIATTSLDGLTVIAGLAIAILGTVLATGLSRHVEGHLEIAWTKPIPRDRLVAQTFAIDIGALALAYFVTVGVLVAMNLVYGMHITFSPAQLGHVLAEFLFAAAMYALVQGVTSAMSRRSGMLAGMSWPILLLLSGVILAPVPDLIHRAIVAVNYLNPLALISSNSRAGTTINAFGSPPWSAVSVADGLFIIALGFALAILQWRRLEA